MKKITLLLLLMISSLGFSQNEREKIQNYLNDNRTKLNLTNQDIQEWFIDGEASSENTGINNYYVKQKYQGTELYNSSSNFWIKNNQVINGGQGFITNVISKVNTTTPSLSVLQGLNKALTLLEIPATINHEILTTIDQRNFKISNGNLDTISAKLVYQSFNDKLRLAWDFIIDVQDHNHVWSVRIDAVDGKMLAKYDMVISCNFGDGHKNEVDYCDFSKPFSQDFFKPANTSILNVNAGSYRVVPYNYQSISHSPRQLITSPAFAPASPNGWHNANSSTSTTPSASLIYTITRGNNVWAQADYSNTNPTANASISPDGGTSLTFDFPVGTNTGASSTYIDAANTNLFYMNNIMHDVWFMAGFNSSNKNFQKSNNGVPNIGGGPNDPVDAHAQDSSALPASGTTRNNANFFTPANGAPGRMQMYVWNYTSQIQPLFINSPADIAGERIAVDNAFNPGHVDIPVAPAIIQSDLVLYDDGTADAGTTDNADACGPALNAAAINGKIVVIRRSLSEALGGTPCNFVVKVKNAQNAGAIAVIMVNNVDASPTVPAGISMSGADATITIPAIAVSKAVGYPLIERIKTETVNAKIQLQTPYAPIVIDGDLDNGIIAHEYGHGISNRLSGSSANCLTNAEQMGEGWSDWFTLMMQLKSGDSGASPVSIGSFAANQPNNGGGIRNYPYSTDMLVNPLTFNNSNDDESHNRGEFLTAVLWDLSWAYIVKYGFDPNFYTGTGGNNKVMKLVVDALKLQPCSPTFVEFRDALISAEQATVGTGGNNNCLIKEVFRRRGMGLNASSGSRDSALDQVENFTAFTAGTNCTNTLGTDAFIKDDIFNVFPNPSNGIFNIRINQYSGKVNIQVVDINGRIVKEIKNEDFNTEKSLDLSALQAGIYVLKINNNELNFSKKVIKN